MPNNVMQYSFNSGEWAPSLYARVDLTKYRSGAALMRNFFADYRGGASTRMGTRYILQTFKSTTTRLIPFQASFTVDYVLEFGDGYVRFFNNGAPVLEAPTTISAINIGTSTITDTAHGYANGDWVFIQNIVGTVGAQLNGNYYIIAGKTTNTYTLTDLNGVAIVLTGAYTSGGTGSRVYTLTSPYAYTELSAITFAQNVSEMILCHPNHPPYVLTLLSAASWTLAAITFGSSIAAPTGQSVATTLSAGSVNYAYVITANDVNGQESDPSAFATLASKTDLRTVAGTNTVTWSAVTGAVSYNVYKAELDYSGAVPAGSQFGFSGNVTATTLADSNIGPDYSQVPPVSQNPFNGTGVASIAITAGGSYTNVVIPSMSFSGGGGSGCTAIATAICNSITIPPGIPGGGFGGTGYTIGDLLSLPNGVVLQVLTTISNSFGLQQVGTVAIVNHGAVVTGVFAATFSGIINSPSGGIGAEFSMGYTIGSAGVTNPGTGYATPPTPAFSSGAASATATLGAPSAGNPTVPGFFQQRLVLAGPVSSPQQFNMSKTGSYFNFDNSAISQPDDAIQGTLISGQLNTLHSMLPQPQGLLFFGDKQSWLINGGSPGSAVAPASIIANAQAFIGAAGPPPIVANNNILFVQAKGSIVRDTTFNFYTQVYMGMDVSTLSSHLFYGFQILEWAWAEEPFKLIWAIRSDGTLLSLTYLKEQEFVAWSHHDTQGAFKSVATVVESTSTAGNVDAIYVIVQRTINGNTIQYIERMAERIFPNGLASAWCVDSGLNFTGAAALTFSGAQNLAGATVTGIQTDDKGNTTAIPAFTMPTNGTFTLTAPPSPATGYTNVTVGLAFTPQLQTLAIDAGEPTIQGKLKSVQPAVLRVTSTLGLSIGRDSEDLVPMQDLILGNVNSMATGLPADQQTVTGLWTGDARTYLDPAIDTFGQIFIEQDQPFPATITGAILELTVENRS